MLPVRHSDCLPASVSELTALPMPQELTVLIKALARDGIHPESFCYMEVLVVLLSYSSQCSQRP